MKILLISDKESPVLYQHFEPDRFADVELVISCGDLHADYLEFVISMLNKPCYYVPGNHDTSFVTKPPPGWHPLDGKLIQHRGISLMGLGGSMRYKPGPYQYSEFEMRRRFFKLRPAIWWQKNTIDILVTHAPAWGLGDLENRTHQGFKVFREILDVYKPKYFLHGHVHLNYSSHPRQMQYGETLIINGFEHHVFDF